MADAIAGLHHVTAISGPPQPNVDFFVKTLRQRLVKKTVNFDDPGTYHLYYGDAAGSPGTIMTYFPFANAAPGRAGPGMASALAYAVPSGGLEPWMEALAEAGTDFVGPQQRLGERFITVPDPDGLQVELIEKTGAAHGTAEPRDEGFHSVSLWVSDPDPTARVLTEIFGYQVGPAERSDDGERLRFAAPSGGRASAVDVVRSDAPSIGRQGAGSIHHVAFRAASDAAQLAWREKVASAGLDVTPVIDRQYFNAIYFREPGGILFEIATDPPGFAIDESPDALGTALKLPPRYEARRDEIEARLPPINAPA